MVYTNTWISYAVCTSLLLASSTWAKESVCKRHAGVTACKQGLVSQIQASGIVDIEKTAVEGMCNIRGQYAIKKATLQAANLYGNGSINDSHIIGKARIFGNINAVTSRFDDRLDVWSNRLTLEKVQMKNLHMHTSQTPGGIVMIGAGSSVLGDIIFEDAPGIVKMHNTVKMVGKVVNGKIVKEG